MHFSLQYTKVLHSICCVHWQALWSFHATFTGKVRETAAIEVCTVEAASSWVFAKVRIIPSRVSLIEVVWEVSPNRNCRQREREIWWFCESEWGTRSGMRELHVRVGFLVFMDLPTVSHIALIFILFCFLNLHKPLQCEIWLGNPIFSRDLGTVPKMFPISGPEWLGCRLNIPESPMTSLSKLEHSRVPNDVLEQIRTFLRCPNVRWDVGLAGTSFFKKWHAPLQHRSFLFEFVFLIFISPLSRRQAYVSKQTQPTQTESAADS